MEQLDDLYFEGFMLPYAALKVFQSSIVLAGWL